MNLQDSLKGIKKILVKNYKNKLAAILVFGSANTGEWKEGKSDIDLIILFKDNSKLELNKEKIRMFKELKEFNPSIVHFITLTDYYAHIYNEGSWSSWITVICGSKTIYSTKEFQKIKRYLIEHPIPKKKILIYLKHKDKFELEGYIKKSKGFPETKGLFSHIRRKIQILNYLQNRKIKFYYKACLDKIKIEKKDKEKLKKLYFLYKQRKNLSKKETKKYIEIAKKLTNEINQENF